MGTIEINKLLAPYQFDITLSGKTYTIDIKYNILFNFFTASLSLEDKVLVENDKLVLDEFLFDQGEDKDHNLNPDFPEELLYVGSEDKSIDRVSWDNLGSTVFLYYMDRNEVA
jgi:hypothetical protein